MQPDLSRVFLRLDEDRADAADRAEGILAYDLAGSFKKQRNRAREELARLSELIHHAQHHARGVDAIAVQFQIVGANLEGPRPRRGRYKSW